MATKHELYQSHPAKDPFDTEPAILHLEQGLEWLTEALVLAKEGTIDSLLKYFETGYTSGNWHFPTITTHYAHGLGHRLAKMLEDELLAGTGFHFKYSTHGPQDWHLFYTNPDDIKEDDPPYVERGQLVGRIEIWTRELDLYIHFGDKQVQLDKWILDRQQSIRDALTTIDEQRDWLSRYEKNLFVRLFRHRHLEKMKSFAPEFFDRKRNFIKMMEEDIQRFRKDKEKYEALEQLIVVLDRFKKYGFVVTPARSEAESEAEEKKAGDSNE